MGRAASPALPRPLLGTDTIGISPAPSEGAAPLQRHCQDGSDGVSALLWPQQGGGWPRQPAPSPALLSFPSHPFPSSLPSCVPHFLAFCAAWDSSRIFSAVVQPTSEGKGWMTKPNPSSKPTVSRRTAGSRATPVPHPSSLLPPSAPGKSLHTAQVCRMPCIKPSGGFYLGRGQRCQWKLSCRRGARRQRRRRRSESPVRAQHCFTPHFCLLWRPHRAGPLLPPAGLAGGRPAPRLPLRGVTLAAFISETEEKRGQGAVEKEATGSRCLRAPRSERSVHPRFLLRRPGLPKKPSSRRSHFAASCSCYCLLTANGGPWGISSVLEG